MLGNVLTRTMKRNLYLMKSFITISPPLMLLAADDTKLLTAPCGYSVSTES